MSVSGGMGKQGWNRGAVWIVGRLDLKEKPAGWSRQRRKVTGGDEETRAAREESCGSGGRKTGGQGDCSDEMTRREQDGEWQGVAGR